MNSYSLGLVLEGFLKHELNAGELPANNYSMLYLIVMDLGIDNTVEWSTIQQSSDKTQVLGYVIVCTSSSKDLVRTESTTIRLGNTWLINISALRTPEH
jgi:hypothetical protein